MHTKMPESFLMAERQRVREKKKKRRKNICFEIDDETSCPLSWRKQRMAEKMKAAQE